MRDADRPVWSPAGTIPERITPEDLPSSPDHLARYLFAAHWAAGRTVLDVGCGMGYGSSLLAAAGSKAVWAVDGNSEAVAQARERYGRPGLEFLHHDITAPVPIPPVDLVVCLEAIEHVTAPDALLAGAGAALAPGGRLILSTPNAAFYPGGHSGNPYHVREYRRRELEALVSAHFRSSRLFCQWAYADPLDSSSVFRRLARLLVPLGLKRRVPRTRRLGPSSTGLAPAPPSSVLNYRPFPATHLSWPGLRSIEPFVWILLCEDPLRLPRPSSRDQP